MQAIKFNTIPATDNEYVVAFDRVATEHNIHCERARFGDDLEISAGEIATHPGLRDVLQAGVRVFPRINYIFANGLRVQIERQQDGKSFFDIVTVDPSNEKDVSRFLKIAAVVQKAFGEVSLRDIGSLLGPDALKHYEAREVAVARLEKTASELIVNAEQARQRREIEFERRERDREAKYSEKLASLEETQRDQEAALKVQIEKLDEQKKELDDRAAKHARRQHYKDIKEKFKTWSDTFKVTKGTRQLRYHVYVFTILLLAIFGGGAVYYLTQSLKAEDTTHFVLTGVKQLTFTALFVSTAFFFIRWNTQWFQRHANEEFRLKRLELDIDRASWFVEMAFEWKEQKGEQIPQEIIERLTSGLFSSEVEEATTEASDPLSQVLQGATRFKVKLPDGTELEFDRKGMQRLMRERWLIQKASNDAKS